MARSRGIGASFPSQAVSDQVKKSEDYGKRVARAIESEWFVRDSGTSRFNQTRDEIHRLRLYARGEQSVQKYKSEFAVNGDLSYLNLDWKPVPIIPKFVDLIVNGMQSRTHTVKAFAQDPIATDRRTKFVEEIEQDMASQELIQQVDQFMGINISSYPPEDLPHSNEELELYMKIAYKQGIEIAEEQAIENVFLMNDFENIKRRIDYDIMVLGIGCSKHTFNTADGIRLDYVDPANIIYSYTEDPTFQDIYYFGEVRRTTATELKKQFPEITDEELEDILKSGNNWDDYNSNRYNTRQEYDNNTLNLLYFNWKTYEKSVYKIKETSVGTQKALKKDDKFNPPKDARTRFERVAQAREVVYQGVYVLGRDKLLKWEKEKNMVRPKANTAKVLMDYVVCAPRLYKGRIESMVRRMTSYADLIQLTHLKIQQVIQRMTPSGVYLDADGLAEIDLGNGTSYNPQEALNMYFQTGSVIGRSLTVDGDPNPGKIPIQELPGGGGNQLQLLVEAYNQYIGRLREVTGISEARDGSLPHPDTLVGVQKLAALNSNVAVRHLIDASMFITLQLAEGISLRLSDALEFHPQKEKFIQSLGRFTVGSLEEVKDLNIHDFGIFLELEPDEEEKTRLEDNIQQALSTQSIELEDAIDIREVSNLKLANQLLKYRRARKKILDQQLQEQTTRAQAEAQGQAQAQVAQAKAQSEMQMTEAKVKLEEAKTNFDIKKLEVEAQQKKGLMQYEYELNVKLKELELEYTRAIQSETNQANMEMKRMDTDAKQKEKDIKAQTKAISGPPRTAKPKKSFESKGNDVLGSIELEKFEPK